MALMANIWNLLILFKIRTCCLIFKRLKNHRSLKRQRAHNFAGIGYFRWLVWGKTKLMWRDSIQLDFFCQFFFVAFFLLLCVLFSYLLTIWSKGLSIWLARWYCAVNFAIFQKKKSNNFILEKTVHSNCGHVMIIELVNSWVGEEYGGKEMVENLQDIETLCGKKKLWN